MKDYIIDLIHRMNVVEKEANSDSSISFQAYRDAEELSDSMYIPTLIQLIELHPSPQDKKFRSSAYFILGKLLFKIVNLSATQFLIHQLRQESDKYVLSSMLDAIADLEKPETIDIMPILDSIDHEKWLVRYSAIRALEKSRNPTARLFLVHYLESLENLKKYRYEITYANSVLSDIGEPNDIRLLARYTRVSFIDIKDSANYAIKRINKRQKKEVVL